MLFHVNMEVRIPHGVDPEKIKQLGAMEHERARERELQLEGKWLHLWRIVGKFANVSVFDVETPAELQGRHPSGKLDDVFRQLTMEAA